MSFAILPVLEPKEGQAQVLADLIKNITSGASINEAGCKTYYFFIPETASSISSTPTIHGIELYTSQDALTGEHLQSPQFGELGKWLQAGNCANSPDLGGYNVEFGFIDRTAPKESDFVFVATLICKPGQRAAVLDKWRTCAPWVWENEPDTYSYLFLTSMEDENKIVIFERYKNKEALTETHYGGPKFQEVQPFMKENVAEKKTENFKWAGFGFISKDKLQ